MPYYDGGIRHELPAELFLGIGKQAVPQEADAGLIHCDRRRLPSDALNVNNWHQFGGILFVRGQTYKACTDVSITRY